MSSCWGGQRWYDGGCCGIAALVARARLAGNEELNLRLQSAILYHFITGHTPVGIFTLHDVWGDPPQIPPARVGARRGRTAPHPWTGLLAFRLTKQGLNLSLKTRGTPRVRRIEAKGVGLCLAAAALAPFGVHAQATEDSPRVYAVNIGTSYGVYLGKGLVITAAHVVGRASQTMPSVRIAGMDLPANAIKEGSLDRADLTLLSVDEQKLPIYLRIRHTPLCERPPWAGEPVIVAAPEGTARSHIMSPQLLPFDVQRRFSASTSSWRPGAYGPGVAFTNVSNGQGSATRPLKLIIQASSLPRPTSQVARDRGGYLLDDHGNAPAGAVSGAQTHLRNIASTAQQLIRFIPRSFRDQRPASPGTER